MFLDLSSYYIDVIGDLECSSRHVKFQFSNFFLSPPHHSLLAMEKKSTQLHTLIDFHSNFGQALRWDPATYAPPAFKIIT